MADAVVELDCCFKKAIDVKKIAAGQKSSFEFSEWRVSFASLRAKLVVVYRPPYSEAHSITPGIFFEEFGSYLETVIQIGRAHV